MHLLLESSLGLDGDQLQARQVEEVQPKRLALHILQLQHHRQRMHLRQGRKPGVMSSSWGGSNVKSQRERKMALGIWDG